MVSSVSVGLSSSVPEITRDIIPNNSDYTFLESINGFTYEVGYLSEDEIEDSKNKLNKIKFSEGDVVINGYGTGLTTPTERELEIMEDVKFIKSPILSSLKKAPGASYDISSSPYFPEVRSQQTQGSCGAWASTYYAFGFTEAKDNGWNTASVGNDSQLMQPAWTFNKVSCKQGI